MDQLQDSPFDRIIKRIDSVQAIYEDEKVIVFPSKRPCAKVHLIVLAKTLKHRSLVDVQETEEDEMMLGHMMVTAAKVANQLNIQGYRIVNNSGKDSYQTIHNLYLHIIGGQKLSWPPYNRKASDVEESKESV